MDSNLKDHIHTLWTAQELEYLKKALIQKGLFVVNKPLLWTSNDVVQFLKRFLKVKKIGHGGTLDPLATGLLVIGVNEHTKKLENALNDTKTYCATIQINQQTTTGDREGTIVLTNQENQYIQLSEIYEVIDYFHQKQYSQAPPIHSAIKIKGKQLYHYARSNIKMQIPTRDVRIFALSLIDYCYPHICLQLTVSKGFYVRSFAQDFCAKLNRFGHLIQLERIATHGFMLNKNVLDIERIKQSLANKK